MSTVGLTLGKFAPFHKGHQHLLDTALAQVDHLIVVVYESPAVTTIPLPLRAQWIRDLYPAVEVIEGWDGPPDTGYTAEIKAKQERYILGLLQGRSVTHFFSSELYGEHMSQALGAQDCRVDPDRTHVPISGEVIRKHPYQYRDYISDRVYPDLVTNVVFMGAPSTGKTTIATALATHYSTVWMPEYGRDYWEEHQVDRRLTPEQLVEIAEGHLEREQQHVLQADRFLFTDTNAITTYMFALDYHGQAHPRLTQMAREAENRYDIVFVCDTDIPYEDTWERSGAVYRERFQRQILADLHIRRLPYFWLRGTVEERIATAQAVLDSFQKYTNPFQYK